MRLMLHVARPESSNRSYSGDGSANKTSPQVPDPVSNWDSALASRSLLLPKSRLAQQCELLTWKHVREREY